MRCIILAAAALPGLAVIQLEAAAEGRRENGVPFLSAACKGLVAAEFDVPPRAISVDKVDPIYAPPRQTLSTVVWVSYIRASDGARWRLVCREAGPDSDGSTVIEWASVREYPQADGQIITMPGRWRNDPRYDDHIRVRLQDQTLTAIKTFRDGGEKRLSFRLNEMQSLQQRR